MNKADEINQAEKRRILAEDKDRLSTLLDHSRANADLDLGGRFAKLHPTTVTGTTPDHQFPKLPADNPFNQAAAMVPNEPPLGIDINAMEPTGEVFERGDGGEASPVDGGLTSGPAQPQEWKPTTSRSWRRL
jgi:hypothetical protein